jgi:hypothetical protein
MTESGVNSRGSPKDADNLCVTILQHRGSKAYCSHGRDKRLPRMDRWQGNFAITETAKSSTLILSSSPWLFWARAKVSLQLRGFSQNRRFVVQLGLRGLLGSIINRSKPHRLGGKRILRCGNRDNPTGEAEYCCSRQNVTRASHDFP